MPPMGNDAQPVLNHKEMPISELVRTQPYGYGDLGFGF